MKTSGFKITNKWNGNSARPKFGINVLASLLAAASLSVYADTTPTTSTGWYFDGRLGRGSPGFKSSDIDGAFSTQGITSTSTLDKHDASYALDGGYKFNPYFAVEGGYVDLGQYKFRSNVTAPAADMAQGKLKAQGWTLAAVGILPLDSDNALYGKAGVVRSKLDLSVSDTGAVPVVGGSKSGTNGLWGLGVSHEFGNNVFGKLEWDRYQHLGDASTTGTSDLTTYTLGVGVRF